MAAAFRSSLPPTSPFTLARLFACSIDLVDLIYRALTRQDHPERTPEHVPDHELNTQKRYLMLPPHAPGAWLVCSKFWSIKVVVPICTCWPMNSASKSTLSFPPSTPPRSLACSKSKKATPSSRRGPGLCQSRHSGTQGYLSQGCSCQRPAPSSNGAGTQSQK